MPILALLAFFGIAFGLDFFGPMQTSNYVDKEEQRIEAYAYNMALYEEAAKRYVRDNPSYTGDISDAMLNAGFLPDNYYKMAQWGAKRTTDGYILTYISKDNISSDMPPESLARHVQELKGHAAGIGIVGNDQTTLYSAQFDSSVSPIGRIPLPVPVLEGTVLILSAEF